MNTGYVKNSSTIKIDDMLDMFIIGINRTEEDIKRIKEKCIKRYFEYKEKENRQSRVRKILYTAGSRARGAGRHMKEVAGGLDKLMGSISNSRDGGKIFSPTFRNCVLLSKISQEVQGEE